MRHYHRALQSANIPSMREPPGTFKDDQKRVDSMELWSIVSVGCNLLDTVTPFHLHLSLVRYGSVANKVNQNFVVRGHS